MNEAFRYYDDMVINYKKWQRGGIDKNISHNKFINAAISLARLGMPNPFNGDLKQNANPYPTEPGQTITAVAE